jgi:hypothetical protein
LREVVTFEVESRLPIEITQLLCAFSTGATSANVWVRTGGVEHSPGQVSISTANGWWQVVTGAALTGADNTSLIPVKLWHYSNTCSGECENGLFHSKETLGIMTGIHLPIRNLDN